MKKIPTLFKRVFYDHSIIDIVPVITEGCEEAFKNGIATVKIDGACCAIIDGKFYKRYDAKKERKPPEGAIPCCDPDPVTGYILKPLEVGFGYVVVELWNKNGPKSKKIHRLVAEAFLPNPDKKPQVNHIDGNKKNNRLDNLEWVTASENMKHSYDSKIRVPHQERPVRIVETGEIFKSVKECAEKIEGHDCDISRCLRQSTAKGLTQANGYTHKGLHFEYVNEQQSSKKY